LEIYSQQANKQTRIFDLSHISDNIPNNYYFGIRFNYTFKYLHLFFSEYENVRKSAITTETINDYATMQPQPEAAYLTLNDPDQIPGTSQNDYINVKPTSSRTKLEENNETVYLKSFN